MTEPDEALLWARKRAKERFSSPVYINICAQIDAGDWDDDLTYSAEAYRAGAAASAERIKALEARVAELEADAYRAGAASLIRQVSRAGREVDL